MNEKKVSVIVPIYNVEEYLEKCLNSLCRQSLEGLEVIAVNDGSPDSSQKILEQFEKEFPSVVRVFQKENGGLSDARNFGLEKATGKYVAFLDGDDYVDLDLYEKLYEKAEETGADAVACDIRYVWPDGKNTYASSGIPSLCEGKALKKVFTRFYPAVWNKIYRRDKLLESGVIFKKGYWFEDVEFSHRLFPYLTRLASVEVACVNYVQREGSVTAKADLRLFHYLDNFETVLAFFKERELLSLWEKELEYATCRYLLATFLKRAGGLADEDYEKALRGALDFLGKNFPRWKKNPYFLQNGIRGLYLLLFTPTLARFLRRRG